ncbi:MAG: autotransporter-associated beta strand repeat-containing protein [Thermoguttaceae bacterium]
MICIFLLTAATSQAATYNWDPGTVAGGGVWTWDLALSNWYNGAATPPADIIWPNTADTAYFGAGNLRGAITGGAVTVAAGGVTAGGLNFNIGGYSLSGGPITMSAAPVTIANGVTATISSNLLGAAGLQLTPVQIGTEYFSGTLVLNGDNSGLGGNFNLGSGQSLAPPPRLIINSATALGSTIVQPNSGINGYSIIDCTVPGGITLTTNNTVNINGNLYFGGTQNLNFGAGSVLQLDTTSEDTRVLGINGTANLQFGALNNTRTNVRNLVLPGNGTGKLILGAIGLMPSGTNAALALIGTHSVDVTGTISNAPGGGGTNYGAFTWNDSGTLTLSGSNNYIGTTILQAGTVVLDFTTNNNNKFGGGVPFTNFQISGLVNLQLKGGSFAQTETATTFNAGGSLELSQTGGGSSTMVLNAITSGNGTAMNLATGSIATTTTTTNATAGILAPTANRACITVGGTDWAISGASGTNPITAYSGYTTGWSANNQLVTAAATTLPSTPATSVYTLKVNNSASGSLDINGSTLTLSYGGLLFTGSAPYEIKNGTLNSGSTTNSDLIAITNGSGALTISAIINNGVGAQTLTKSGTGTLIVSGLNTYTGATYVNEGLLQLGSSTNAGHTAGPLGTGVGTLQVGGTVDLNGQNLTVGAIAGSFGTILNNNASTPSKLTIGYNNTAPNSRVIISNAGAGTISVEKVGTGTWTIPWAQTYTGGTTLSGGIAALSNIVGQTLPFGSGPVTMNGATLNWYSNGNQSASNIIGENFVINNVTGNIFALEPNTIWTGSFTGSGLLSLRANQSQSQNYDMQGDLTGFTGTFEINATTTNPVYFGMSNSTTVGVPNAAVTMVSATTGTTCLQWGGTASAVTVPVGSLASASANSILRNNGAASSTATFSVNGLNNATTTFAGSIRDGTGTSQITALTKNIAGNGTFTLTGTNTYTGATTVNNGTIELAGTGILGSTNITVNNGGTFKFDAGSVLNNATATSITVNSGGTLQTAAALTNLSALNVHGGGVLNIQGSTTINASATGSGITVDGSSTTPGILSMVDGSVAAGTLNLSGGAGTSLTLGGTATNPSVLNFELSIAGTDQIFTDSKIQVNDGGATVNITGLAGYYNGTFPLITFNSKLGAGTFTLNSRPATGTFSLNQTGTQLQLVVTGLPSVATVYWKGDQNGTWSYVNAGNTNWRTVLGGTEANDPGSIPTGATDVYFTDTGPSNLTTTLGADIGISSLHFNNTATSSVTIGGSNTLYLVNGITVDSGSGAHTVSATNLTMVNPQTWSNNSSNTFTVSSSIKGSGAAALELSGGGLFVFSGPSNTYSGGTTIDPSSKLQLGSANAVGTGQLTVNGSLDLHGNSVSVSALSGTGTITDNSPAATITVNVSDAYSYFNGLIQDGAGTGVISLIKSGTGTATLSTSNNYSGGTTISNGILAIGDDNALGTGNLKFAGTGATLQYVSGTKDFSSRIKSSTSAIMIDVGSQDVTYAGRIDSTNTAGLTLKNGGSLTLSGSNSFTGTVTISVGTLKLGREAGQTTSNALGNAANNLTIASGAVLDLNGQSITQTGTITLGGLSTGIITNSDTSNPATFNADIMNFAGGTTGLTLNSPGDIAFKRIDQVTGNATGQLLIWDSPATITLGTSLSTDHNRMLKLQLNQGTALLNMPQLTTGTTNPISVDRGLIIGSIANNTSATVRITGASNNQLSVGQPVQIDYGVFDFNGHSITTGGVISDYSTGVIENTAVGTTSTVSIDTDYATIGLNTFNGVIQDHDPAGTGGIIAVTKLGPSGTQTLTSVNTYTGPTAINEGILQLSGSGSISNSSAISIASGATFDVSSTSGAYSTGVGQTISGFGTILGSYTHNQGTIAPGTDGTAGTLTFDLSTTGGTLTISGGNIKYDALSTGSDQIVINAGTGTMSGAVTVNVNTGATNTPGTYTLISQTPGGTFNPPTIGPGGWTTTWDRRGTAPTLSTTANSVLLTVNAAAPGNALNWSGAASGAWDIVTSVNWYNTTTHGPDMFYRDDSVTFGDTYVGATPPAITTVTLNTTVAPTSVTFNNSVQNYTLGGTGGISGATSLVKSGSGTLTITMTNSANNSYSGGTVINGGILSISDDNNVGADAGRITINKTGVSQAVLQTTATLGFAVIRPMTIGSGGGAIQVASGTTLTFNPNAATSATCDFEGPLAVTGDGALTVNLAGTPIVGAGASMSIGGTSTLNVGGSDPFTNGSTHMSVTNNGALNITSGSKTVGALSGTGNTTLSASTQLTATSVVQNTLTIGAGATLTIAPIPGGPLAGMGSISPVPEPSTWALLMLAAMGLGMYWRRSR